MSPRTSKPEIVKLPAMGADEVETLLASQKVCRMALNDVPHPYIVMLDYVYMDGKMYFHFADYGRKMDLVKRDPHVGVEVDNFCDGARRIETITLMGEIKRVRDKEEKARVAKALIATVKARGGKKNVAARHGFSSLDPEAFAAFSSQLYRLVVSEYVALISSG